MEPKMSNTPLLPAPRAVIFDWDDTVVDNWSIAVKALNTALVQMGLEAWTNEQCLRRAGGSAKDLFFGLFGDRWQEADKIYYDTFHALLDNKVNLHNHIEDIFRTLHGAGVYLAVVSNKRGNLLRAEAGKVAFDRYFGRIVGAGDATADKPDPAPVLLALQDSGVVPGRDVWFIGDSHADMICAHRAGCSAVLIETKPPPEDMLAQALPHARMRDHLHLMEFIGDYFA